MIVVASPQQQAGQCYILWKHPWPMLWANEGEWWNNALVWAIFTWVSSGNCNCSLLSEFRRRSYRLLCKQKTRRNVNSTLPLEQWSVHKPLMVRASSGKIFLNSIFWIFHLRGCHCDAAQPFHSWKSRKYSRITQKDQYSTAAIMNRSFNIDAFINFLI